jgi:hypothetical protein
MSLFTSTNKTTTTGTTAPTNPKPVTDSLIDFTKLISSLGKRDPRQFVTGPSNLQNAAFGMGAGIAQRYGIGVPQGQMPGKPQINQLPTNYNMPEGQMNTQVGKPQINQVPTNANSPEGQMSVQMGKPQYSSNTAASMYGSPGVTSTTPVTTGQGASQGGGLFERAGIQQTPDTGPQQLSAQNYTPDQGLKDGWARVRERPKDQAYIRSTGGDYDNNGSISEEEYYNWHRSQFNDRESYQPQTLAAQQATQAPQGGGQGFSGGVSAAPGIGYNPAQMGQNPNDVYRDATDIARGAGMAGPNRGQLASLGQANTYGASGPANVGGYNASGPANVGGYDASRASAQGYNAQDAGSRGYDAATIGEAERVRMGPASQASASQGIQFSQPYENRFTDNVVNTTLANMDEFSGRQRAQEAADAARNNAFSGSRFGVQRAITEEQIARERASQEAGLRFGAQDRAFGLGMQDAGTASQVSQSNAAAANQMAQAQAMMDQQRLMANMDARNQAGQFGAAAGNQAAMFNAGSQNTARQFGAGAQNQANMFNAQAADAAGQFGADARNRAAMDFTGRTDQAGQFGANARNQAQMDFAGRQDTAGQFNAGAQNQFDLSQFGAANNMSQFNAGMDESSLMRALAASGQMGQLAGAQGTNERADLQMLSALGADERAINQQGATADLQLMNMMAQLYGTMPYNLFTGQNTSGTQTVRNTPSAFDSYLAFQSAGADAAKKSIAPTG